MGSTFMDDVLDCGNFFDQIDDLLDFPPENECMNNILGSSDECKEYPSIWKEDITKDVAANSFFPGCNGSSASDLSAELSVPYDDIIQLEWLSTFVEDSFSGGGMTLAKDTTTFVNKDTSQNTFHTSSPVSVLESSSCGSNSHSNSNNSSSSNSFNSGMMVIPVAPNHRTAQRARSKRPRPATFSPRSMSLQLMPASSGIARPVLVPGFSSESENVRVYKHSKTRANEGKKKTKPKIPTLAQKSEPINPNNNNIETTPQVAVRKCLHCEITKTPQWRAGPLGPKTLCNACGVRYKSGRLFPEYRPAASPTFVPSVHSNSHKKVVEMRNNIVVDKNPAE